jgi:DNA-binding transcriptional ArsR family regulator
MPTVREPEAPALARFAGLLADPTRAAFCLALLDGRAWTAGELARHAGVARSTASEHLDALVGGGVLAEHRQGRHRYVRLAGTRIAELIEDLSALAPDASPAPVGLRAVAASRAMARARTCYDHLAGRLGVAIADAMSGRGYLDPAHDLALTEPGMAWLRATLAGVDGLAVTRRPLVRSCVDWSERRPHLAGAAGAALCRHLFEQRWITRIGTSRAVAITPSGERGLRDLLGLDVADLGAA